MMKRLGKLHERWTYARFERQMKQLLPELYRTARRLTSEPADAEDLVHDACLKAFRAFERADIRGTDACRAWLRRILVNTYRGYYRRQMRSPVTEIGSTVEQGNVNVVELAASPDPEPAKLAEYKSFADAARATIAALPPEVRLVATLFFISELSYREIAEIVDCPIGTVMSRLARGRRMLRQQLGPYVDVPDATDCSTGPARGCPVPKGSGNTLRG